MHSNSMSCSIIDRVSVIVKFQEGLHEQKDVALTNLQGQQL